MNNVKNRFPTTTTQIKIIECATLAELEKAINEFINDDDNYNKVVTDVNYSTYPEYSALIMYKEYKYE